PIPKIDVKYTDGSTQSLQCVANQSLDPSTAMAHSDPTIMLSPSHNGAFRFERPQPRPIRAATLAMTCVAPQFAGPGSVSIFRLKQPLPNPPKEMGIAHHYVQDEGLADHPSVRFFADCAGDIPDYFDLT